MAEIRNFRKSISGFNREDVVQYIEYMNNRHAAQLNQLKSELQAVKDELEAARQDTATKEALDAEKAESQKLRDEVAALKAELEAKSGACAERELEAYRRAERCERAAKERVDKVYAQVNSVLETVTKNSETTADQISQVVDSFACQITDMQAALEKSKQSIREAAETMKAIRPVEPEC